MEEKLQSLLWDWAVRIPKPFREEKQVQLNAWGRWEGLPNLFEPSPRSPQPFVIWCAWVWNIDRSWQTFSLGGQVVKPFIFIGHTVCVTASFRNRWQSTLAHVWRCASPWSTPALPSKCHLVVLASWQTCKPQGAEHLYGPFLYKLLSFNSRSVSTHQRIWR